MPRTCEKIVLFFFNVHLRVPLRKYNQMLLTGEFDYMLSRMASLLHHKTHKAGADDLHFCAQSAQALIELIS